MRGRQPRRSQLLPGRRCEFEVYVTVTDPYGISAVAVAANVGQL